MCYQSVLARQKTGGVLSERKVKRDHFIPNMRPSQGSEVAEMGSAQVQCPRYSVPKRCIGLLTRLAESATWMPEESFCMRSVIG